MSANPRAGAGSPNGSSRWASVVRNPCSKAKPRRPIITASCSMSSRVHPDRHRHSHRLAHDRKRPGPHPASRQPPRNRETRLARPLGIDNTRSPLTTANTEKRSPTMSPTVREIQRFLHQHARRFPSRPAESVMRFVTDWAVIQEAWRRVRSSPGANTPGADRVTARDLPPGSVETRAFLHDLADRLQAGTYRPGPVRRFEIPKPHHPDQTRPLAILTLADRVVQMTLKLILEPIVEARLGQALLRVSPGPQSLRSDSVGPPPRGLPSRGVRRGAHRRCRLMLRQTRSSPHHR